MRTGRDVRIAALHQRPELPPGPVLAAVEGHAEHAWEAAAVLDHLGMAELTDADTGRLSGGQAKRVALARTLVADSDLLILDEPTNHLDIDAIAWLEERLAAYRGGLVLVTHDRHVLDRVTTRVLELDRGKGYVHDGGYDVYLEGRAEREEQAAADESSRRILARKELAWLRRGAPARTRKPKARIESATAIVESRAEPAARQGIPDLWFGTPRLGDKVVELHDVAFAHPGGDRAVRRRRAAARPPRAARPRRPQRRRQVDPARPHRRSAHPDEGRGRHRHHRAPRLLRPGRRHPRPRPAGARRRHRRPPPARLAGRRPARVVLVRRRRPVGPDRPALGRRAPSPPAAARAGRQAQRAAARRAHQRPRHRHAAGARGLPRRLARRPRRGQPRPGLPRAHRHRRDGDGRRRPARSAPRRLRRVGGRAPGQPGPRPGHHHRPEARRRAHPTEAGEGRGRRRSRPGPAAPAPSAT